MSGKRVPQQSIHRAIDILETLQGAAEGIGVTALAKRLGLATSTTHNILKALKQRGFVAQDPQTSHYLLGPRLIALANHSAFQQSNLLRLARAPLNALHASSRETVFLGVLQHNEIVYLRVLESTHPITIGHNPAPGSDLHCTAMGKVLISGLSSLQLSALIDEVGLPKYTDQTITDRQILEQELGEIRANGYATNRGEETEGIHGVAAPIFGAGGGVMAGVCVGYPIRYRPNLDEGDLIRQVKACAHQISAELSPSSS